MVCSWVLDSIEGELLDICRGVVLQCVDSSLNSANSCSKENKYLKNAQERYLILYKVIECDF